MATVVSNPTEKQVMRAVGDAHTLHDRYSVPSAAFLGVVLSPCLRCVPLIRPLNDCVACSTLDSDKRDDCACGTVCGLAYSRHPCRRVHRPKERFLSQQRMSRTHRCTSTPAASLLCMMLCVYATMFLHLAFLGGLPPRIVDCTTNLPSCVMDLVACGGHTSTS